MDPICIFFPIIALALLTLLVLLGIPIMRFRAAFAGSVTADDFKYGESARVPTSVSIPNRNYMNLLELPTLFYAVGVSLYATGHVDTTNIALAWIYVAFRALHSVIHLTYNKVVHRLTAFAFSNFILIALWLRFLIVLL